MCNVDKIVEKIENVNEYIVNLEKIEQDCIAVRNSLAIPKRYLENSDQFISIARLIEMSYKIY